MKAKKLVAVALVAGYFFAANCRFICAMGMPDRSSVVAEHRDTNDAGACHRRGEPKDESDGQKDHSAPCCATHLDSDSVLLPTVVTLQNFPYLVAVLPNVGSKIVLPLPRLPSFWEDRGPPLINSQIIASSSCGPRAPPFPAVVL
ncbi:MAG: hypothetical protein AAB268_01850 [Elusimicrobiota bacterium]